MSPTFPRQFCTVHFVERSHATHISCTISATKFMQIPTCLLWFLEYEYAWSFTIFLVPLVSLFIPLVISRTWTVHMKWWYNKCCAGQLGRRSYCSVAGNNMMMITMTEWWSNISSITVIMPSCSTEGSTGKICYNWVWANWHTTAGNTLLSLMLGLSCLNIITFLI